MNPHEATRALDSVHEVLDRIGIRHFITDGTLLGAVREGAFIEHDLDIDIGVFAEFLDEQIFNTLMTDLAADGFREIHRFGELGKEFELSLERNGIKVDLFFYHRDGARRIFHAFRNGGRTLPDDIIEYEYPAELIEELGTATLRGKEYPAPANAMAVLEEKYGHDWRTPRKDWDWADDPRNKSSECNPL